MGSTVSGNSTTGPGADGGGIYVDGSSISTLTLSNSTVVDNHANHATANGGGIFISASNPNSITGSIVAGNTAGLGSHEVVPGNGTLTLDYSLIEEGSVLVPITAGMAPFTGTFQPEGELSVLDGMPIAGTWTLEITDDFIASGTGLLNSWSLLVDTVSPSAATEYTSSDVPVAINSGPHLSTINIADPGTITDLDVRLNIDHTRDADLDVFLIAPDGTRVELFTDVGSTGDNYTDTILDDEGTTIADLATSVSGSLIGTDLSPIDPLLGPLADNGGPTETHALLAGSPAIDAGNPGVLFNPAEFDQRGSPFARVVDGDAIVGARIDIGAFEDNSSLFLPTVVEVIRNDGGQNFNEMITLAFRFNEHVNVTIAALSMHNDTTDTGVDLTGATFNYDPTTFTAEWNLSVPDLPAAFYTATLNATLVTDGNSNQLDGDGDANGGDDFVHVGTNNPDDLLVAILGDVDLDGAVTIIIENPVFGEDPLFGDAVILNSNIGTTEDVGWAGGDIDGDGAVTILIENPVFGEDPIPGDAAILNANIGMSVVVPAPDAAATYPVSSSPSEPLITLAENVGRRHRAARVHAPSRTAPVFDVEPRPTARRPLRKTSMREVDLALTDLTDDRFDRHEHDRLAEGRNVGRLDAAWDEGLMAVVSRPL